MFMEIFDGLMLSDGGLTKPYKNALYNHSCKHIEYLYYLKNLMAQSNIYCSEKTPYTYTHKKNGAVYHVLISRRFEYLTQQYYRWYPNRIKTVPKDLVITPNVMRHWYYGDGHLGSSHGKRNHIVLYTNGFTDNDREILQIKLQEKGWISSVMSEGRLYIGKTYFESVLEYIDPCTVSCFQYKYRKDHDIVLSA